MKNIIIVLLVLAIGAMAYLQFVKDDSTSTGNQATTSNTSTENEKSATSGSSINLSGKGLSKISKDTLDDRSVTVLDVSKNQLTGALPAEIRMLVNLEVLDASNNKMTGIPAEIGQLKKLRIANFANNNISGLPLEIGNISGLGTLDLRGNPTVSKHDISLIQSKLPHVKILTD